MYSKVASRVGIQNLQIHIMYSFHRGGSFRLFLKCKAYSVTFLQSLSHTLATNSARVFFARKKKFSISNNNIKSACTHTQTHAERKEWSCTRDGSREENARDAK